MIEDIEINQAETHKGDSPPQDVVLDALPKETATDILKTAQRFGVREDDPLWVAILTILHAHDLTESVQDASTRIEDATKGVGEMIFNQTVRAGDDLKTLLKQALEEKTLEVGRTVVDVIRYSTNEGAAAIRAAASSLPAAAAAQRDGIIQGWKIDFSSLAAQEAAQRAQRREWWWTGAAVAFGLVMALTGSWVGYRLAPRPRAWPTASPPVLVANFGQEVEFQWENTNAFIPRACPQGRVCVVLKK